MPTPTTTPELPEISESEQRIIDMGRSAWVELKVKPDWHRWIFVGQALDAGRTQCMRTARANQPAGRGYNEAFGRWLRRNDLDDLDKPTRAALLECIANLAEIERWRGNLPQARRNDLNSPRTVLRYWRLSLAEGKAPTAGKPTPLSLALEENARLKAELAALRKAGGGSSFTRTDRPDAIAKVIVSDLHGVSADKLSRIRKALDVAIEAAIERQKKP
jgi:hypothetical protein